MAWAGDLAVKSQADVDSATVVLRGIKEEAKGLDKARRFLVDPLNAHVKRINEIFNKPKALYSQAESMGKEKVGAYLREQERIRIQKQQEEQRKAEALKKRRMTQAAKAMANGDQAKAQELVEKAHAQDVAVVAPEAEAAEGSHTTTTWKAEVTDPLALIKGIAAGTVPWDPEMVSFKQSVLDSKARSLKDKVKWPGVRFYPDTKVSIR